MTIRFGLGKLPLDRPIKQFLHAETLLNNVDILAVSQDHIFGLLNLPQLPRDPFDRIIAAQCQVERVELVSGDEAFDLLGAKRIWK